MHQLFLVLQLRLKHLWVQLRLKHLWVQLRLKHLWGQLPLRRRLALLLLMYPDIPVYLVIQLLLLYLENQPLPELQSHPLFLEFPVFQLLLELL